MYFHNFIIISPWKRSGLFFWTNLNPLHPRMHFAKFGWNRLSGSGEEAFYISSMYFCYLIIISPWKKMGPFIWINFNPQHPRMLCAKFGWNWQNGFGEEDFWIFSMYFCDIVIFSAWKTTGLFIWTTHPKMHCVKFG